MKSVIIFFLFSIIQFEAQGQKYSVDVKVLSECNKYAARDYHYFFLLDSLGNRYDNLEEPLQVPGPGCYRIVFLPFPDIEFPEVFVSNPGITTYTYTEPRLVAMSASMHGGLIYYYCGELINGFKEDYYPNNQVRIRGVFKKGFIKDSLEIFYTNGVLKESMFATKDGSMTKKYDSLSNLLYTKHRIRQPGYLQYHIITEYYAYQKTKRRETYKNNYYILEEYYPDGRLKLRQSKKRRVEFAKNGQLTAAWKWVKKRDKLMGKKGNYSLLVRKKLYNEKGKLIELMKAEIWTVTNKQPLLSLANADWLIKWVKWSNGKKTVLATNDDPDKFLFPVNNN